MAGAGGVSGAVLAWVQGGVWVAEVVECGVVAISSLWSWVLWIARMGMMRAR